MAIEQPQLRKGIIMTLVESVMLQDRIPYETTGALQLPVTYLASIPTVPLRHINETATSVEATHNQLVETLHIFDTDIDIDPVLLDNKNQIQPIEVVQTKAVTKALGYRVNDLAINGDPTVDAREPMGLKFRLTNDVRFNGQTVNADSNTTPVGVSPAAADANFLTLLNKLDELFYLLEFGAGTILIVNRQTVLTMWAGLRKLKLLDTTRDQFDREIGVYRGVPIIDVGFKASAAITGQPDAAAAATNQIIGNNADTPTGGGSNAYTASTVMYAVRLGEEYTMGLQQTALHVKPIGQIHTSPHYHRTNIRWVVNPLVPFQKRAIARLVGFDTNATTAPD
jgi:hypothetical protein